MARKLWPPLPGPPPPRPPPLTLMAGMVPLIVRSFRVSPPAAADTSCKLATVVTAHEPIGASVAPSASVLMLILVPAAGALLVPARNPKPNEHRLPHATAQLTPQIGEEHPALLRSAQMAARPPRERTPRHLRAWRRDLPLDQFGDDHVDLRVHQRLAAGDGHHRRARLLARGQGLLDRHPLLEDLVRLLSSNPGKSPRQAGKPPIIDDRLAAARLPAAAGNSAQPSKSRTIGTLAQVVWYMKRGDLSELLRWYLATGCH